MRSNGHTFRFLERVPIESTGPKIGKKFKELLKECGLKQPVNGIAASASEAFEIAGQVGYPLVIRPSYVPGGGAMEIVAGDARLRRYISEALVVSGESSVLLDRYLEGAVEVDVGAVSDRQSASSFGADQCAIRD